MDQGYFPTLFPTFPWSNRALNASKLPKNCRRWLETNLSSSKTYSWLLQFSRVDKFCTVNKFLQSCREDPWSWGLEGAAGMWEWPSLRSWTEGMSPKGVRRIGLSSENESPQLWSCYFKDFQWRTRKRTFCCCPYNKGYRSLSGFLFLVSFWFLFWFSGDSDKLRHWFRWRTTPLTLFPPHHQHSPLYLSFPSLLPLNTRESSPTCVHTFILFFRLKSQSFPALPGIFSRENTGILLIITEMILPILMLCCFS